MKNSKLLNVFLISLIIFVSNGICEEISQQESEQLITNTWYYSKTSQNNVLHDNSYPREDLYYMYKDTQIKLTGNTLEISNICSTQIVKLVKKPINYWRSSGTEELYNRLFNEEQIPVKEQLNIITALYPDQNCPEPFDELIIQDHWLIAIKEDYLILFLNQIPHPTKESNKDGSICKELDFGEGSYRGGDTCFYPNQTLLATYKQYWKKVQKDKDEKHLRAIIEPMKNYKDIIEKGHLEISYLWISKKELKIELSFAGGVTELVFKEKDKGTEMTTIYNAD